MLTLYRTPFVADHRRFGTLRRILVVGPSGEAYAGIENAVDKDKMPAGEHELIMATMSKAKLAGLWLPGTELFGHPANYAMELSGCWAIGRATEFGVTASAMTFGRLFDELGGFLEGRKIPFRCYEVV